MGEWLLGALPPGPTLARVAALAAMLAALSGLAALAWSTLSRRTLSLVSVRMVCLAAATPLAIAGVAAALSAGVVDLRLALAAVIPFAGMAGWTGVARLARPMLDYQQAVRARAHEATLILGECHAADDLDAFNPSWVELPEKALFTNLHVVGGIGSGKTSGVMLPLLDQLLHKHPDAPERRPFVLLLDIKGGLAETVRTIAERAGRGADVVELTPGGAETVNLLAGPPEVAAARLLDALAAGEEQPGHPFYRQAQEAFVRAALAALTCAQAPVHIGTLYSMVSDPDFRTDLIARAERVAGANPPRALDYFRHTFNQLRADDAQSMLLGLANQLALWVDGPVGRLVCTARPTFGGWIDAINRGRIVVVTLPESTYGETLCRRIGLMLLTGFCDAALARTDPSAEVDRERLVVALIDEAQKFICRRLATFASVSRQARCCTVLLHQNLAQIPEAWRDDLAANFRSHLVLNVSDAFTARAFSDQFGESPQARVSRGVSKSRGRAATHGTSETTTEVLAPRWGYTEIMQLAPERGILSLYDGERLRDPQLVRLRPWYRAGGAIARQVAAGASQREESAALRSEHHIAALDRPPSR